MSSPLSCVSSSASSLCAWIGIDVSKLTLDVCCLTPSPTGQEQHKRHKRFANTPAGWQQLLDWVQQQTAPVNECHFALEPTGTYGEGLALFLSEQNLRVSLVNPARVRHTALAAGICNKTDKLDAYAIARFCRNENPALYTPPAPEYRKLAALARRRENLLDSVQQEKNRLDQPHMDKEVKASLTRQVRFLETEIARVEKALCEHIRRHAHLAADAALLESIPGISTLTAQKILAELADVRQYASSGSAAAYAGLAPQQHASGTPAARACAKGANCPSAATPTCARRCTFRP
jgi:transposase